MTGGRMIDLHCHILPGLDDGAQNIEESVAMARAAVEDGITAVVATPHLFRGGFPVENLPLVERKRKELASELKKREIPLDVFRGVEVRFSHNLIEEVRKNRDRLVINKTSYMFVEFPFDYVYSGVREVFFQVMSEGIVPIITHPERTSAFLQHPELLAELIQMGALAQANAGSFTGVYGSSVQEGVIKFLRYNLIHVIASDGHNVRGRPPRLTPARRAAAEILGDDKALALVRDNPQAVLEDRTLPYLPEPADLTVREKSYKVSLPSFFKRKS